MITLFCCPTTFRIRGVLIHYTGDLGDLPAPTGLDLAKIFEYVVKTYPIGRIEFSECIFRDFDKNLRIEGDGCGPGWTGPGGLMEMLRGLEARTDDNDIYVGLLPRGTVTSVLGCGSWGIAATKVGRPTTMAQEVGHALGRKHAPGGTEEFDHDYPTYGSYPPGSIGEFGFDTTTSEVYDPAISFDIMSYRGHRWISPYTYLGLRDAIIERFGSSDRGESSDLDRRETLFLNFNVHRDGRVDVATSFHLPSARRSVNQGAKSAVSCELLDKDGKALLFRRCHVGVSQHDDVDAPFISFFEAIPWLDEAQAIRFLRDGEVVHVHEVEPEPPQIEMEKLRIQPENGAMNVEWRGGHADRQLTYMLRHSNDGGMNWRVVAADLQTSNCRVPQHFLRGGEQCVLQLVASSGIRTSIVESETYASPLKARTAFILKPEAKMAVGEGEPVILIGGAYSPDFGIADAADTVWSSSFDGVIGRGIEIVATELSRGPHTISLTVPDGTDGVATQSVLVHVTDRTSNQ